MQLPVIVIADGSRTVFSAPAPFTTPDGTQHPATAWDCWTADDWAEKCPEWTLLPVTDIPPAGDASSIVERLPESDWEITDAGATVTYRVTPKSADQLAAELEDERSQAVARINSEAGAARSRFITVAIGQEGTYLDKGAEAEAYVTDPAPAPERYPYLYAEAEATGQPVQDVAALVQLTAQAWRPINARIEGLRQGALKAVKDAGTTADVAAVFPINWPMPG